MTFEELIRNNVTPADFDRMKEDLGSPHRRTKLINHPEDANWNQLLLFSAYIGKTALELYENFNVGMDTLSDLEVEFLTSKSLTYNVNHRTIKIDHAVDETTG